MKISQFRLQAIKNSNYNHHYILNSDWTGFQYEKASNRTLSDINEKCIVLSVGSVNATTHSLTIQSAISKSGKCVGKLFICLKQKNNSFAPLVKKRVNEILKKCKNVTVMCSKSEKMSNYLTNEWAKSLFDRNLYLSSKWTDNLNVLLDSFTCQWNSDFDNSYDSELFKIKRMKIPSKSTYYAQPQDRGFNYELKYFVTQFTERISIDRIDIDIKNRLNTIELLSLLWDQLSSEKFHKAFVVWLRAICFKLSSIDCDVINCENYFFIKCAHCENQLYIRFYFAYHFHNVWN